MRFENLFGNNRITLNFYFKIYITGVTFAEKKNVFYSNNYFRDLHYRDVFKLI